MQAVTITSTASSGQIYVDDAPVGTGKVAIQLDRTKTHTVIVRVPGGQTGAASIGRRISGTGVLDLVGGVLLLVPFLGLFGPGFWELDPDNLVVNVGGHELPPAAAPKVTKPIK